jgi:hypothetical protein
LGCQFVRSGFGYLMDYVTPSRAGILADIGGERGHPGPAPALANVQEGCVGTSGLGSGGVAAVSPVVTSVLGEITADVLMTCFYLYWRRGRFG